jgi:hypothetical protein
MPRSRWKASMSSDLARKPPDGSGSSTMCGWSHSIMRAVISALRLLIPGLAHVHMFRSRTTSRRRCSSSSLNSFTAATSAAFWSDAWTSPRCRARCLSIDTRHDLSLAAVGFVLERWSRSHDRRRKGSWREISSRGYRPAERRAPTDTMIADPRM